MTVKNRKKTGNAASVDSARAKESVWQSPTFRWGMLSVLAVWLSFPPVGIWPLGWVATIGWIRLVRMPRLVGPRPYLTIYLMGYLHWLLMTQWVRLPHWAAGIGWFFLAAYLTVYVLLFVAIARVLVHRCGIHMVLAAPAVWVSLELVRAYAFTGWALALLSHSQFQFVAAIQLASWTGAYGVSFLLVMSAAAIEQTMELRRLRRSSPREWLPVGLAAVSIVAVICGGMFPRTGDQNTVQRVARVALVQGSLDTVFDGDAGRIERSFADYLSMSTRVITESPDIDLVIWPESMFSGAMGQNVIVRIEADVPLTYLPADYPVEEEVRICRLNAMYTVRRIARKCLVGTTSIHYAAEKVNRFNTAAVYDANGTLLSTYHKMHPVMFGEYLPFGRLMPVLYRILPFYGGGLSEGVAPMSFQAGGLWFSPSICFENTVPHLIRSQLRTLEESGRKVDVLVTLTNDGWFWGSSLLDLHLACGVYRAIENGKPMLICANTGISAHIDPRGRILKQGQRRQSEIILADVPHTARSTTIYSRYGDWFPGNCLVFCLVCLGRERLGRALSSGGQNS